MSITASPLTTRLFAFLFLIILSLILIVWYISKNKKHVFSGHLSKYIIFIYSGALFLSCLTVYALPEKDVPQTSEDPTQQVQAAKNTAASLLEIAGEGKLDSTPGIYRKADFSFPVKGNQLVLAPDPGANFNEVIIEKKETDDGIVTVYSYITAVIVQGLDVTAQVQPPVIQLDGNRLKFGSPERYTLNYAAFKPDFTAEQFTAEDLTQPILRRSTTFGHEIIYLQIPKNMTVIPNQMSIYHLEDL